MPWQNYLGGKLDWEIEGPFIAFDDCLWHAWASWTVKDTVV